VARRINRRLIMMARELGPVVKTSNGTELAVVKDAAVKGAFAKLYIEFVPLETSGMDAPTDISAHAAGQATGD
jgi:hypothetical protein